jgi:UDP-GlcNAc:undecaprenyl-phosphate GlcNAc-1-phosphate transferase
VPGFISDKVSAPSAFYAFAIAALFVWLVGTPLAMRAALRLGVVDRPGGRRIHERPVPLLGGIGILAGILVAAAVNLPVLHHDYAAILLGAICISALGAVDDARGLPPSLKFAGQAACALLPISQGVTIDHLTLPFLVPISLGLLQYPVTVLFIVAVANIVNFSDGMDGLAAGICAISALTFAVLAVSMGRYVPATLAAAVAGSCLGFLRWNFHPAKVFMGDSGSLPLGFLLASMSIVGFFKTFAALSLVFPLTVMLVPIADTSFVILKRLKYGRSVTVADANHLHHRMLRIGYSQRQAALRLYAWCAAMSGFALAVKFLPARPHGHWQLWPTVWLSLFAVVALGWSVYVVYALEIVKYRHLRMLGIARRRDVPGDAAVVTERRRRRDSVPLS